jgi:hypothetical protein
MEFQGRIPKKDEVLVKYAAGKMHISDSGNDWVGSFTVSSDHALRPGGGYTLLDDKGGIVGIEITAVPRHGPKLTAEFKSTTDWR